MDGYAVHSSNIKGASSNSPVHLKVSGAVAAGETPKGEVTSRTAIRIMTGASIPKGANTVVPFEDTDEEYQTSVNGNPSEIQIFAE